DDFFQLGGHSLLAVQLMMRIEKEVGKKVPLTSLFKFSTFESFVRLYDDPESKETISVTNKFNDVQLTDEEIIVPTTESQKEMWLSCVIGGDKANIAYNLPSALKLDGDFNFAAFKKALTVLIKRHEALRINISSSGESLIIHPTLELELD